MNKTPRWSDFFIFTPKFIGAMYIYIGFTAMPTSAKSLTTFGKNKKPVFFILLDSLSIPLSTLPSSWKFWYFTLEYISNHSYVSEA